MKKIIFYMLITITIASFQLDAADDKKGKEAAAVAAAASAAAQAITLVITRVPTCMAGTKSPSREIVHLTGAPLSMVYLTTVTSETLLSDISDFQHTNVGFISPSYETLDIFRAAREAAEKEKTAAQVKHLIPFMKDVIPMSGNEMRYVIRMNLNK